MHFLGCGAGGPGSDEGVDQSQPAAGGLGGTGHAGQGQIAFFILSRSARGGRAACLLLAIGTLLLVGHAGVDGGLAQLFNQRFPGRRVARWALIAPWAASVMMTSLVFRWALDPNSGVVNVFLHDIGVLHAFNSNQADWLGRPWSAFVWMMIVAVFVSLPFSTYALLAGLQAIPAEVYEAARVDGASKWRAYRSMTLPLLRPSLLVAALINVINVFNSFPIIWEMTRGGPGYETATTTVFMFQLKQNFFGESAAMSVINFGLVIVLVVLFLRATRWREQVG